MLLKSLALALGVCASGLATPPAAPLADFHSKLVRAEPAVDSTVKESPARVRLWFNEACEVGLSTIKILDASGAEVALGKATATDDPRSIAAAVTGKLAPGRYQVVYKTAGGDGHAVRGEYAFTVSK